MDTDRSRVFPSLPFSGSGPSRVATDRLCSDRMNSRSFLHKGEATGRPTDRGNAGATAERARRRRRRRRQDATDRDRDHRSPAPGSSPPSLSLHLGSLAGRQAGRQARKKEGRRARDDDDDDDDDDGGSDRFKFS